MLYQRNIWSKKWTFDPDFLRLRICKNLARGFKNIFFKLKFEQIFSLKHHFEKYLGSLDPSVRVINSVMTSQMMMKVGYSPFKSSISTPAETSIPAWVTSFVASRMTWTAETAGKAVTSSTEVSMLSCCITWPYDDDEHSNEKVNSNLHFGLFT